MNYIEIKLPRCVVCLTLSEMIGLLQKDPVLYAQALQRGKGVLRARAARKREQTETGGDNMDSYIQIKTRKHLICLTEEELGKVMDQHPDLMREGIKRGMAYPRGRDTEKRGPTQKAVIPNYEKR